MGVVDFHMGWHLTSYLWQDPHPTQVQKILVSILHCIKATNQNKIPRKQAIADMAWINLFLIIQPGEYCQGWTDSVSTPFGIQEVQLYVFSIPYQSTTSDPHTCLVTNFSSLMFAMHKSNVKLKYIWCGETGNPRACVVASIRRRVAHLQNNGTSLCIPFISFHQDGWWSSVRNTEITKALWAAVKIAALNVGFKL